MRNEKAPVNLSESFLDEPEIVELRRKYDELVVNYPEGIEAFRHEVLKPEEFYYVFRWCVENFGHAARLAKLQLPESVDEVMGYSRQELYHLQNQHQWTWNDMMSFLDQWIDDQLAQMKDYPQAARD